ncbi:MAG: transporter [Bacteroidales bacterium]
MKHTLLALLFLLIVTHSINAQIITDRPTQAAGSSIVARGAFQIESGILLSYEEVSEHSSSRQLLLPTTLFRYGLSNIFELRVAPQYELNEAEGQTVNGFSDLSIGTKIQLLNKAEKNTQIAFLTHLIVPTGTSELRSDKYGTSSSLCLSNKLCDNMSLGYNIGYNYFGEGNGDFTYSAALGIGVNDKVGIYIEPYGALVNMDDFQLNADAGFTYLANNNLQFDLSFGTGINNRMNYMSVGCSWLFK